MNKVIKENLNRLKKEERLHQLDIPILAITGGIASGKSTVSQYLKNQGHLVINADELIHQIYEQKDTKNFVHQICPEAIDHSEGAEEFKINFSKLREKFFKEPTLKKELEAHLYQKLPVEFHKAVPSNATYVFYDVPLLFEKGLNYKVDATIVVTTSKDLQLKRLSERDPSSSEETNEGILKQQWPLQQKEDLADIVILNKGTIEELKKSVDVVLHELFIS